MNIKKIAITLLAVGLFAGACAAGPGGIGSDPKDAPPSGNPAGVWIAGDSIAEGTGYRFSANGDFSIAQGSTGFIHRGIKASNVPERIALMRAEYGDPTTLVILAGGNDLYAAYSEGEVYNAAVALHDDLEADGIDVRFVTEPIPDSGSIFTWTNGTLERFNDSLISTFGDTIDCGFAGHPTEVFGSFPVHPISSGYDALAQCIYNNL